MEKHLAAAIEAAYRAGKALTDSLATPVIKKKGQSDYVSDMDLLSERIIREYLIGLFGNDAFLGEEGGYIGKENPEGIWVVDPIDGTANFLNNIPFWSISIGYEVNGEVIVGVVYSPTMHELFSASKGNGAFLNGKRIQVSNTSKSTEATIIMAPPIRHRDWVDRFFPLFKDLFSQSCDNRIFGSAALHLCYVACGRVEAYIEFGLMHHDLSAGSLILTEAGGNISPMDSNFPIFEKGDILACNAKLYTWYMSFFKNKWKE
jgi:myo-inositol-1(or 4)-monophosphatase